MTVSPGAIPLGRTRFVSELRVRPDDIDMNQHVHGSRYFDYVLAARYDQMERCYGMSMEAFQELGYGWFTKASHFEFKRPLKMGDAFLVTTWIEAFHRDGVRVHFEIHRKEPRKLACSGWCDYTLVGMATGRSVPIPADIARKYAV
ncbi:MAG: acyl-CoA thioesterase [Verrucomicrobiales bacterium]|nr:acyl-CoA thioesterase [Verrucomicrobiales bacterium]